MKIESQKQPDHVFFLATENIFIHVNQPFRIQQEMIETRNFIPEAFMIHQIQESKQNDIDCNSFLNIARGEKLMPALELETWGRDDELFIYDSPLALEDNGDDDEDWDEDDEDWDEEDEDWDEEDEDWDEEDDEWDEDEDEFDDDDDEEEDWSEDEEAE